ncbi:hypothetical protein F4820DRAFT_224952 [Hypoxylon rubiginosum]|uniref:Uncharacterized protein n=1 Tax=Hypoxylon rubiginosum TaxID=110542 RepID=A0ACB9Z6B4_9PEZI|nr:hypothetical protein F4820DRAFT_224952 [Hypoxylon rubiginosum]
MSVRRRDIAEDIAVISLLIFVISLIIWVHYASPFLTVGTPSNTESRILTVGVTIGATITTAFIGSQIQSGLIRGLENRLRKIGNEPYMIRDPANKTDDDDRHIIMKSAEKDWRSILNIDGFWEKIINYRISIIFPLCSLITTSIVTSLTPTLSTMIVPYDVVIPDASFGYYSGELNRSCFGLCEAPCNESFRSTYSWALNNGSFFYAAKDGSLCPLTLMMQMAQGINTGNTSDNVYSQAGVAVERNATGAPNVLFSGSSFRNISSAYGNALISTTQCVPVMTKNPVRCEVGGNVTITLPNIITAVTNDRTAFGELWPGNRTNSASVERDLSKDSAMVSGMAMAPWPGAEHIGKIELNFAAVNDPAGQVPFASYLAGAINDPDEPEYRTGSSTYSVTCVVNPHSVFEYRSVTLDLRAQDKAKDSNLAQYMSASQPCTPVNPTISNKLFAAAGTSSHLLVYEHSMLDGYIPTLIGLSGFHRKPPYAFPDSTNAFEDVLGLVSGLAVSMVSVSGGTVSASALEGQGGNSTALIEVTRLGSDSGEALWLLIPPICSLVVLLTLSFMSFRRNWTPGGRDFHGTAEQRPERYAAESLYQIITLGITAAKIYPKIAEAHA